MASDITTYLKFSNVQMAAEADYKTVTDFNDKEQIKTALILGNNRSSKFAEAQATQFVDVDKWTVVDHKANTRE